MSAIHRNHKNDLNYEARFVGFVATEVFCLGSAWVCLKSILPPNHQSIRGGVKKLAIVLHNGLAMSPLKQTGHFTSERNWLFYPKRTSH